MDLCSYKLHWDKKLESGNNESRGNFKDSQRKEVEVVWACDAKRGALCRKEGYHRLWEWKHNGE